MTYEDDDLPEFYVPDEELRPVLESIGNAVVERLRTRGLTGVVVYHDDMEGQTHVTAYFKKYPQTLEETDAIWERLVEVDRMFFHDVAMLLGVEEADAFTREGYADQMLFLRPLRWAAGMRNQEEAPPLSSHEHAVASERHARAASDLRPAGSEWAALSVGLPVVRPDAPGEHPGPLSTRAADAPARLSGALGEAPRGVPGRADAG